jgi:hypothetical protein
MLVRLITAAMPQPKRAEEARVLALDPVVAVLERVTARQESY